MTEVEFHTGLADPQAFACRLLRKAARRGAQVLVTAPEAVLAELDRALWTFDERDFVPHARLPGASATVLQRSPIWLAHDTHSALQCAGDVSVGSVPAVLVNIGAAAPADLQAFTRLIEVVSAYVDEAQAGRERWRAYRATGLQIVHHQGSESRVG